MAGAALHPSPDDPGHVHPYFTFTGQLPQHQAVHLPMRAGRMDGLRRASDFAASPERTKALWGGTRWGGVGWGGVALAASGSKPQEVPYADAKGNRMRSGMKDTAEAVE